MPLSDSESVSGHSAYPGSKIVRGSEAYTTKQCGWCGFINPSRKDELFACGRCKATGDRDVVPGRSIVLKFLKCQSCAPSSLQTYLKLSASENQKLAFSHAAGLGMTGGSWYMASETFTIDE